MPTTQPLACQGCDRPVDVTTTNISIYTTLAEPVYTFTCRRCGCTNQRAIDGSRLDFLAAVGFPIDGQEQPEIRFGR